MKAVMRELAQAKRHHSTLPLFAFLRDESPSPRERVSLVPGFVAHAAAHERFAIERAADADRALRSLVVDVAVQQPLYAARLAHVAYPATPTQTRVLVESLEHVGAVWRAHASGLATPLHGTGGEAGLYPRDRRVLDAIVLEPRERAGCLEVAFRVFDLFADLSNELHREARAALALALARRVTPHTVHSQVALRSAN